MVYFITGNKSKAEQYGKILGRYGAVFDVKKLDVDEIQSDEGKDVAIAKAKAAYKLLRRPLFVNDTIWEIPSLGGFPGPYMKYMNKWLTTDDFLRLMKGVRNRNIKMLDYFCATTDGKDIETFVVTIVGKILNEPRGRGDTTDMLVTLPPYKKSIGEMIQDGTLASTYAKNSNWKKLAEWIKRH